MWHLLLLVSELSDSSLFGFSVFPPISWIMYVPLFKYLEGLFPQSDLDRRKGCAAPGECRPDAGTLPPSPLCTGDWVFMGGRTKGDEVVSICSVLELKTSQTRKPLSAEQTVMAGHPIPQQDGSEEHKIQSSN